jgi:hypothetical protein
VPGAIAIDDLHARQSARAVIDIHLSRRADHVIEILEGDLNNVVLGIVDDTEQGQPFRLDLAAESERCDLDFSTLADEAF